jgi:hypothetical protein
MILCSQTGNFKDLQRIWGASAQFFLIFYFSWFLHCKRKIKHQIGQLCDLGESLLPPKNGENGIYKLYLTL